MTADKITLRIYLTIKGCQAGGSFWAVNEAIEDEYQGRDLDELRTMAEWEAAA